MMQGFMPSMEVIVKNCWDSQAVIDWDPAGLDESAAEETNQR